MDRIQSLLLNPLKPIILPITTNLPTPFQDTITSLLGATCHSALFLNLDITSHPECLKPLISKVLGFGIIAAASIVKVPQILKLLTSGSAEGVSFTSYLLETASFLITLSYNVRKGFAFNTYGETSLILVQDVVIGVLILQYGGKTAQAGAFVAALATAIYALLVSDTLVPEPMMNYLQAGAGVLSIASKLPQIITVYSQGGTGQLSAFAVFNYLIGSLSRIFTTLQEVDDKLILYGFVAGFLLNAVLACQMLYYWNSSTTATHAGEVKDKKALKEAREGTKVVKETFSIEVKRPGSSGGKTTRRRG